MDESVGYLVDTVKNQLAQLRLIADKHRPPWHQDQYLLSAPPDRPHWDRPTPAEMRKFLALEQEAKRNCWRILFIGCDSKDVWQSLGKLKEYAGYFVHPRESQHLQQNLGRLVNYAEKFGIDKEKRRAAIRSKVIFALEPGATDADLWAHEAELYRLLDGFAGEEKTYLTKTRQDALSMAGKDVALDSLISIEPQVIKKDIIEAWSETEAKAKALAPLPEGSSIQRVQLSRSACRGIGGFRKKIGLWWVACSVMQGVTIRVRRW